MEFRTLTKADCEQVRQWRNQCLYALRTPYGLTEEMQAKFYDDVVCNRNARARFWGIYDFVEQEQIYADFKPSSPFKLIGMTGLENIEWENSCAEISLIIDPELHGKGYGKKAVDILLDNGFNGLGLQTIYAEVYECNPAYKFWIKTLGQYRADVVRLPKRKLWNGEHYDSLYLSVDKEDYKLLCHK